MSQGRDLSCLVAHLPDDGHGALWAGDERVLTVACYDGRDRVFVMYDIVLRHVWN